MTDKNTKRIAKNTLILYIRMLLVMSVTLYTSRVVLAVLGVEDYGIYNVVGGFVAMFSVISGTLSAAISRFLTFELGAENKDRLKKVFSTSINIQIIISIIILLLAESLGIWFLNNKLNFPDERVVAVNWIYQTSILLFIINLISLPYHASIIAHERMKVFAYMSILEVLLKLLIVYLLVVLNVDKLILYGLLLLMVAIIIRIIYGIYCKRNFEECNYYFVLDAKLLKEMLSFAGWNFFGASSKVLKDQGVNIVINLFCGTVVNAARGVAMQVSTAIHSFVNNFMVALNPQITKSYASGEYDYMMKLIQQGARLSFYMLMLLSLPVIIDTETILSIWLVEVPPHTANFVRLVLIYAMFESLSGTLITAMLATGKIRKYQIIVGSTQMLNFPISYILLYFGFFPEVTLIIAIVISLVCLIMRLFLLKRMIHLSVSKYLHNVVLNTLLVLLLSALLPSYIFLKMDIGIIRLLVVVFVSVISSLVIIYYIGCREKERFFIKQKMKMILSKFRIK